jgi:hypothetical protein
MMDRETALDTLRLSANASHADIVAAFSRLARRYPLQQFAERHTRLLEAKSALLSPELAFKDMLFEENIDLNWLNRYTTGDGARLEIATADEPSPRQCLEALFRPHLKNGFTFFPMDTSMENDFAEILDELGPEALQELIDNFDVH